MNINPYLSAMQQMQAIASSRLTLVPSQDFSSAIGGLHAALAPENIPDLPGGIREEISQMMTTGMVRYVLPDGNFPVLVAKAFLDHLKVRGLPKVRGKDTDDVTAAIYRLIQGTGQDTAVQVQQGGEIVFFAKETIRGHLGLELLPAGLAVDTTRCEEAPESDEVKTLRQASETPAMPTDALVGPETGLLAPTALFRLGQEIGSGGFGKVHLGHDIVLDRKVAIKIATIPSEEKRESIFRRFQREYRLQAALASERSLITHITGKTAQGNPYLVMEYLPGGALADLIGRQNLPEQDPQHIPFDLEQTLSLAYQVVAAPAEAHRRGIIHRDIKSENYFLTEDGRTKLGDFGIAQRDNEPNPDLEEGVCGTPGCMSPERLRQDAELQEKHRYADDVFALGVLLYELLTGRSPFIRYETKADENQAIVNGYYQIMTRTMFEDPPPPGHVRPDVGISPALDRIVMKALAKDLQDRYADAQELLLDLVTHKARALEEEAQEILRQSMVPGMDEKIHRDEWREVVQRALTEYRSIHDEYPSDQIRDRMVKLNSLLYGWADFKGDDETIRRTGGRILALAPESEAARIVSRPIRVKLDLSGKLPDGSRPEFTLCRFVNRAGFLELEEVGKSVDRIPAELPRGGGFGIHFSADGVTPIFLPLPVRPGDYVMRIPVYPTSKVPPDFVVIPAGPVAARQGQGSYSEKFDNWRVVDHDYAIAPPVTNLQWLEFLQQLPRQAKRDATVERLPRNWKMDPDGRYRYQTGAKINPDGAVTHISYDNALEYLRYLSNRLGVTVRLLTLNEWKRALRGNDARPWPWGNAMPEMGVAGFRFSHPRASGAVVALPNSAPGLRDLSPFSVPALRGGVARRALPHVAGNVQKFLDFGTPEERKLISKALGIEEAAITSGYYLVAGASYEGAAPVDLDILQHKQRSEVGPTGIMPVIELDSAEPTPSIASLLGQ